jgi:hypothetical protein
MGLESIRAVILFAAGDPGFRSRLLEDREAALAGFELSIDDAMLLNSVRFTEASITFEDGELLERLIGERSGADGFPGFAAPGWFVPPPDLGDGAHLDR